MIDPEERRAPGGVGRLDESAYCDGGGEGDAEVRVLQQHAEERVPPLDGGLLVRRCPDLRKAHVEGSWKAPRLSARAPLF